MSTDFEKKVYLKLKKVLCGKVTTYGYLAKAVGKPGSARAVGNALNKNPYAPIVPCHRVVKSDGRVGGFAHGLKKKVEMLEKEGINIKNGKIVDFNLVLYNFS
jgi:methylated-DNA-[protein]-cysteine S-methyltransferase